MILQSILIFALASMACAFRQDQKNLAVLTSGKVNNVSHDAFNKTALSESSDHSVERIIIMTPKRKISGNILLKIDEAWKLEKLKSKVALFEVLDNNPHNGMLSEAEWMQVRVLFSNLTDTDLQENFEFLCQKAPSCDPDIGTSRAVKRSEFLKIMKDIAFGGIEATAGEARKSSSDVLAQIQALWLSDRQDRIHSRIALFHALNKPQNDRLSLDEWMGIKKVVRGLQYTDESLQDNFQYLCEHAPSCNPHDPKNRAVTLSEFTDILNSLS